MKVQVSTQELTDYPWQNATLDTTLYRLHGFRVLDVDGESVGQIDWIWADEVSGHGQFIGVRLRWLRGTALAVPIDGMRIDNHTSTVRVANTRKQIKQAGRCSIDRTLTEVQKCAIHAHYAPAPATVAAPARTPTARKPARNAVSVRAR
ncbi:MAG: PRC-barrel domain-containing protein [Chloroflexota bacterium]|nr:PRC-barrel domain-containing protein [Chloroflexota bacterium]